MDINDLPEGGSLHWRPEGFSVEGLAEVPALALRIGEISLAAASLDSSLTLLIGALAEPYASALAYGRKTHEKLTMLEVLLPRRFNDSKNFLSAIKRVVVARNSVAHASWIPDFETYAQLDSTTPREEQRVKIALLREKSRAVEKVDLAAMHDVLIEIKLLDAVCGSLAISLLGDREIDESIAGYARGWHSDPLRFGWPKDSDWPLLVDKILCAG